MPAISIIVDVEATCCDRNSFPRDEMEIIEIGSVAVDRATGAVHSEFQTFVRPVRNRVLTSFCLGLTGITQVQVDDAPGYPDAAAAFAAWIAEAGAKEVCSWGDYDRRQFDRDTLHHGVTSPLPARHRNLKAEFSRWLGTTKRFGVGQALRKLDLAFEGTPHRGIDDARNIARVYQRMRGVG